MTGVNASKTKPLGTTNCVKLPAPARPGCAWSPTQSPSPPPRPTGWDVFPWMLRLGSLGYNTTAILPAWHLPAGRYLACYSYPGLGWAALANFTVAGPTGLAWAPAVPKRRTPFNLTLYGLHPGHARNLRLSGWTASGRGEG